MKNLKLLYSVSKTYEGLAPEIIAKHAFNENISYVYDQNIVKSIDHESGEIKELCCYEGVIAIEFVQLNDCLCLATSQGEIIQFNFNDNSAEVVGLVDDGIEAMSWSPDQELVVFVTKSHSVILMFSTFDVLVESSLNEVAAKEFITVGWGKKETQFHGSVGKDARKKEELEVKDVEGLNKTITVCWRGDGEYFAVDHVGSIGRMFKVYNKEGGLQYTSEACANLEEPVAWKPSGMWIAKPEIFDNKYSITLFERNGLKHYELVLPFKAEKERVVKLSWSQDSDIFLVETCREGATHCLYFYTICNYHWYLKHFIEFKAKIVYTWSQNYAEPKQLHIISSEGDYQTLKFDFVINHSNGASESDESIVAVIDGYKLLLTNFKSQMVPPPMASHEVKLDNPVNAVAFLQQPSDQLDSNSFVTIDHNNKVTVYRCCFEKAINGRRLIGTEIAKEFAVKSDDSKAFTQVLWINGDLLVLVKDSTLSLCSIESGLILHEMLFEDLVGSLERQKENALVVQLIDGTLLMVELVDGEITLSEENLVKLPEFCEKIIATESQGKPTVYAFKQIKKKLYLNSKELATEVTSFAVTNDNNYLIYTTIGELKFMEIENNVTKIVESRKVERGSRIVQVVKDKSQIIFQLPRGNLETISPRILSLKIIRSLLKQENYKLALDLLRKERINLNLLIDLNPQKFLKDLRNFITQIDNTQWLNLFLTELRNEDVTTTMYTFCGPAVDEEVHDATFTVDNKISYLCKEMLDIFQEINSQKYLLPSITCHVKNQQLETALQMIWDLKKSGADKDADDSLKYLLYLVDVNSLFNIALGMYDYQLVMFVAQKSQKDPKEYVPFLNQLNKLEPSYAKYKIDCHLKRFSKAVKDIAGLCDEAEKFDECVELVKKHQLFDSALDAFIDNKRCYQRICVLFGDSLRVKGKLLEASLMYERGADFNQALSCARNTLDWQRCIVLAKKSGFKDSEMKELATKLVNSLKDVSRFKEASELAQRFQPEDVPLLVELLVKGRMYSAALVEVEMREKNELIESLIKPQLKIHLALAFKSIEDDRKLYLDQKERLLSIRQEKIRKIENPQEDDDDTFSDTTSMHSSMNSQSSRKTFRSSKTKRKHERKLLNLKEGNKYEDVALIDSIWKLVQKIISNENQNVIKDLIRNAVELTMDDDAKELQKSFKELLLLLKHSMNHIWIPEMLAAGKYPETEEEMVQYNMDHSMSSKMSYELIKPEQRFKPKLDVIDFELEIFREANSKKQPEN